MDDKDKWADWLRALFIATVMASGIVWLSNLRRDAAKLAKASVVLYSPEASGNTISIQGCGKAIVSVHRLGIRLANTTYKYDWSSIANEFDVKPLTPAADKVEIRAKDPEGTQGFGAFTPLEVTEQPGGLQVTGWTMLHHPIDKLEIELPPAQLAGGQVHLQKGTTYVLSARLSYQGANVGPKSPPDITWNATGGVTVSKIDAVTAMLAVPGSHAGGQVTVTARMCDKDWSDVVAGLDKAASPQWFVQ